MSDFTKVIETIRIEQPEVTYRLLESRLRIGQERADHGSLNAALDEAETNARLAHRLYATAQLERAAWTTKYEVEWISVRESAYKDLQREKDSGVRSKVITEGDVTARMASLLPDAWRNAERRKEELRIIEESMKNLADLWISRCRSLQTMLSKSR